MPHGHRRRLVAALFCAVSGSSLASVGSDDALRAFAKAFPKGGELHSHMQGAVWPEEILELAKDRDFYFDPKTLVAVPTKEQSYFLPLREVKSHPQLFLNLLRSWSVFAFKNPQASHEHFFRAFSYSAPILKEMPAAIMVRLLENLRAHNGRYLELMYSSASSAARYAHAQKLASQFCKSGRAYDFSSMHKLLFDDGLAEDASLQSRKLDALQADITRRLTYDPFTTNPLPPASMRLLYAVSRNDEPCAVFTELALAFHIVSRDARYVGVNFVRPEDDPVSVRDYDLHMRMFSYLRTVYPSVPVTLHAGELTDQLVANPARAHEHIRKAIVEAGAQRIGHATNLAQTPNLNELLSLMRDRQTLIEVNLTSNEFILGTAPDEHPLKLLVEHEIPFALSTDDQGILRTDLSHEYYKAFRDYRVPYRALKKATRSSLTFSFLPGASIWQDPGAYQQRVAVCQGADVNEGRLPASCQSYLQANPKAALEWAHEVDLARFERSIFVSAKA